MKTLPVFFIVAIGILLVACGKDKFETKPRLEIKDYSSREVFDGQDLRIRLNYYDKEGDLNEGTIFAIRDRLNIFPLGSGDNDRVDTFPNPNNPTALPDFPKTPQGEITFQLDWGTLKESNSENDTIVFRFVVTDNAGNTSDTISTDQLVIRK